MTEELLVVLLHNHRTDIKKWYLNGKESPKRREGRRGGSGVAEWDKKKGGGGREGGGGGATSYGLMGGRVEEHSSHSFRTPLQPAHTSDQPECIKGNGDSERGRSKQSPTHCQGWCLTKRRSFYSGQKNLWRCGSFLLSRASASQWWGTTFHS